MTHSEIPVMYAAPQLQAPPLRFALPPGRTHVMCEEFMAHLRFRDSSHRMMKDTWHHITKTDVEAITRLGSAGRSLGIRFTADIERSMSEPSGFIDLDSAAAALHDFMPPSEPQTIRKGR